jgi:hypothetical protein
MVTIRIFLILIALSLPAFGEVSESFRERVEMRESGGRNIAGKNGEVGPMQLKKIAFIDANNFRKKKGLKTYPLSQIWNPKVNRIVGKSYLELQQSRLRKHLKREPTEAEIYRAFALGFSGYKKSLKTKPSNK